MKIVSMGGHRKDINKEFSFDIISTKLYFAMKDRFQMKLFWKLYQWVHTGGITKVTPKLGKNFSVTNFFHRVIVKIASLRVQINGKT